jgi:chlorophyllase
MQHIASHGFITVVSTFHSIPEIATTRNLSFADADTAVEVYRWMEEEMNPLLEGRFSTAPTADVSNVGLLSYSSGGKVAWIVANDGEIPFNAIAGLMPVDSPGDPFGWMPEPSILHEPFDFAVPAFVLGAGYDAIPRFRSMPACAPEGQNHVQFFANSQSPAWHVVGVNNGHMDVLDRDMELMALGACPSGASREELRNLAKGMLTAFFRASLQGDDEYYAVLTDQESAPTVIEWEVK